MIVDRTQAAQVFGVSPDTIRTWTKNGCPSIDPENPAGTPDQRKRKYDTVRVHRWLVNRALGGWLEERLGGDWGA